MTRYPVHLALGTPLQAIMQVGGWKREAMPTRYIGKYDESELKAFSHREPALATSRVDPTNPTQTLVTQTLVFGERTFVLMID